MIEVNPNIYPWLFKNVYLTPQKFIHTLCEGKFYVGASDRFVG